MKQEGEPGPLLAWRSVGVEGFSPKGISAVVRFPAQGSSDTAKRPLLSDFLTYNGTATILAHRQLPSEAEPGAKTVAAKGDVESCKVCITAASAADSGVTALASAEAEAAGAPLQLFVGLTNGQLWQTEMKQQQDHHNNEPGVETQLPRKLAVASKQLLCCRMAEPVDMVCCYVQGEGVSASSGAQEPQKSNTKYTLMLIALYSDGVAVVSWPEAGQTTELPAVDGGCRITLSPQGDRLAISTRKRRLVLMERKGKEFTIMKDFSPLRLTGPTDQPAQPTWVGEDKLLLPGASQLRSSCKANAWEEAKEAPALTEADTPSHLVFLQHCGSTVGIKVLDGAVDANGEALVCGVATSGAICIWRMQQKEPLVTIRIGRDAQLRGIYCLASNSPLAPLLLLRNDGHLGILNLCSEAVRSAIERSAAAAAAAAEAAAAATPRRADEHKSKSKKTHKSQKPGVENTEADDTKNSAASAKSVQDFLSREAAEASADETESEAQENDLFNGMDPEERTPPKKRTHKHRRRPPAGEEVESQSSETESGDSRRASIDGEGMYGTEAFASSLTALQSELQEAQAMLNVLMKKQHVTKQRLIHPGGRAGVVLAASGSSRSVMEFRCFVDAGSWVKHFPEGETIVAVAAGDSFVAAVTEDRTLRIFTLGGVLLYTADVFGRPVSLCGSQQLLIVLTQTGYSEGFLQLHCSVLHVHPIPSCPNATFRLPISCFKRRLAAPPAAAASIPDVDIIHEGVVRGLLPVASSNVGGLGYAFKWVKLCSLEDASTSAPLFPVVIDETKGELGVIRIKAAEEGQSYPDCSVSEAFFGYAMEQIPLRIPSPDLWSYSRWQRLLRQDKQLKGVGDGGGDAALVPWPQYDELRLQQEMAIRQLNHFVSICGGSAVGGAEGDAEAREAQRKLQLLSKRHDKFCLRGFAKCTDDKRLHGVAKDMALRLKTENAPQHARSLLDSDTRLQADQLREALLWQEQQRQHFTAPAAAPAPDTNAFQKENSPPLEQSAEQAERKFLGAGGTPQALTTEKTSTVQRLLQWQQQQQQQQRKGGDGGLVALFDGQKRRASESNVDRASKKTYFHKAD
ncbi:uncharacterized protein EMH_0009480 [Eimeria mitis]|uniref:WDHD1/CFT4 second beta-propeller domain-containing protein n=1 Tax=Eimeria mitis TaxID=44415 RepID=U6KE04_9EIME|nr:uncharacterized protein EMH_0009480 [Eimeria mitis]CDJ36179.1 hypothetical protein, conserved [Eimeria mitis]